MTTDHKYKLLTVAVRAGLYGGAWLAILATRTGDRFGITKRDRDWLAGV